MSLHCIIVSHWLDTYKNDPYLHRCHRWIPLRKRDSNVLLTSTSFWKNNRIASDRSHHGTHGASVYVLHYIQSSVCVAIARDAVLVGSVYSNKRKNYHTNSRISWLPNSETINCSGEVFLNMLTQLKLLWPLIDIYHHFNCTRSSYHI